ncbi:MAG: IS30 family transposase [Ruminococcus flavefaciens]|nr:IS30 family transposase [Ruminococcus flavefaciens]
MTKKHRYMTWADRIRLEEKLRYKVPIAQIARELGYSRRTIYNEIKRGTYMHTCDFWDEPRYSAQKGQDWQNRHRLHKGRGLKIGKDRALAAFLEQKILEEQCSPAVALELARREGFTTTLCVQTLYNYIEAGLFVKLTSADLLEKPKRKPKTKENSRVVHPDLPSIEDRPAAIRSREEYGHWEMDLVVGPQEGSGVALLTLTERKTRQELIFKLPDKRAASVRAVFDKLERSTPDFCQRFKTIITDNGPEFLEHDKLIKSVLGGQRFTVYYCHSYAAWEKGSNEVHNRMIRRWFPKGTDFSKVSKAKILRVQEWMNHYPRKILGWKSPAEAA